MNFIYFIYFIYILYTNIFIILKKYLKIKMKQKWKFILALKHFKINVHSGKIMNFESKLKKNIHIHTHMKTTYFIQWFNFFTHYMNDAI